MQLIQQGFYTGQGRLNKLIELMVALGGRGKVLMMVSDEVCMGDVKQIMEHRKIKADLTDIAFVQVKDVERFIKSRLEYMMDKGFPLEPVFILVHSKTSLKLDEFNDAENVIIINYIQMNRPEYGRMGDEL